MRAPLIVPSAVALVVAASLASSTAVAAPAESAVGSLATFSGSSTTVNDVAAYGLGPHGIAIAHTNGSLVYYGSDGAAKWTAKLGAAPSDVYVVTEGGRDWVLARVGGSLTIFDARSTGRARSHGVVPVNGAELVATSTRVLIRTSGAARLVNPSDSSTTVVALPQGLVAAAGTTSGVLVTRGGIVQGLWSDNGGWSRTAASSPEGAPKGSEPKLLAVAHGLVVASWSGVVTISRLGDGVTVGSGKASGDVVVAADGSVVAVGRTIFDVASGASRSLPEGFAARSAFEGVVYGTAKGGALRSLDARSGRPLTSTTPTALPTDFTTWRVGVIQPEGIENRTKSVTIAPLKALDR